MLFFIFGLVLGDFFTAIIYRIPRDIPIIGKRSFCPICGATLKASEIIPLVSFFKSRERCGHCNGQISREYPIIEILTALMFIICYIIYGTSLDLFLNLALWSMLLVTAIVDFREMVISDGVLFTFSSVVIIPIIATKEIIGHLAGLAVGFGIFLAIYLISKCIYKQEAFGFGDVMLSGAVGWFLGVGGAVLTCVLSFFIACAVIIILKLAGKRLQKRMEIPFGPFICAAAWISSVFGDMIIRAYLSCF